MHVSFFSGEFYAPHQREDGEPQKINMSATKNQAGMQASWKQKGTQWRGMPQKRAL